MLFAVSRGKKLFSHNIYPQLLIMTNQTSYSFKSRKIVRTIPESASSSALARSRGIKSAAARSLLDAFYLCIALAVHRIL
jgi:hypothetical protein